MTVPVTSPLDGVVSQLYVGRGQVVVSGAALIEVADLRTLWVRVPIYAGELATLAGVREVTIDDLGPASSATELAARRVAGPPAADPLSASADFYFEFENRPPAFRPGQKVGVALPVGAAGRALAVPASAVVYDFQGGAWVYLNTGPHVFVRRRVEVMRAVGRDVVLGRGPAAGARVVVTAVSPSCSEPNSEPGSRPCAGLSRPRFGCASSWPRWPFS